MKRGTSTNQINEIPVIRTTNSVSSSSSSVIQSNNRTTDHTTHNTNTIVASIPSSSSSSYDPPTLSLPLPPIPNQGGDYLVSDGEHETDEPPLRGATTTPRNGSSDNGVTSRNTHNHNPDHPTETQNDEPNAIPPEDHDLNDGPVPPSSDDDESDYEYDYEDEDDGRYTGFLLPQPVYTATRSVDDDGHEDDLGGGGGGGATVVPQDDRAVAVASSRSSSFGVRVETEDEDDRVGIGISSSSGGIGGGSDVSSVPTGGSPSLSKGAPPSSSSITHHTIATTTKPPPPPQPPTKRNPPSQKAISMSLRAEKETTGGRRRLAADLYKIMTQDTREAGFSIGPKEGEDRMDSWTIRLFQFDEDSNLSKDLRLLGLDHVELEMNFPGQYPFEPPFVRIVRPRFKRQTGFVMNGALCMELLTNEGWNPVNDIESVIVSIRSLLVVGDGRLQAAVDMPREEREKIEAGWKEEEKEKGDGNGRNDDEERKRKREEDEDEDKDEDDDRDAKRKKGKTEGGLDVGSYTTAEAKAAYSHLSNFHKKKGWSHWWAKKG